MLSEKYLIAIIIILQIFVIFCLYMAIKNKEFDE